jgi:hypothetical protein
LLDHDEAWDRRELAQAKRGLGCRVAYQPSSDLEGTVIPEQQSEREDRLESCPCSLAVSATMNQDAVVCSPSTLFARLSSTRHVDRDMDDFATEKYFFDRSEGLDRVHEVERHDKR